METHTHTHKRLTKNTYLIKGLVIITIVFNQNVGWTRYNPFKFFRKLWNSNIKRFSDDKNKYIAIINSRKIEEKKVSRKN